jgi:hypothetical protein
MLPRLSNLLKRKTDSLRKRPIQYVWDLVRKVVRVPINARARFRTNLLRAKLPDGGLR